MDGNNHEILEPTGWLGEMIAGRETRKAFIHRIPHAFLKRISGVYFVNIGVLGSRIPLDNLRRTLPLSWDLCRGTEARSLAGSPNPGNLNG
jgi:hypothetical protein